MTDLGPNVTMGWVLLLHVDKVLGPGAASALDAGLA
jgi:hypothetical protein